MIQSIRTYTTYGYERGEETRELSRICCFVTCMLQPSTVVRGRRKESLTVSVGRCMALWKIHRNAVIYDPSRSHIVTHGACSQKRGETRNMYALSRFRPSPRSIHTESRSRRDLPSCPGPSMLESTPIHVPISSTTTGWRGWSLLHGHVHQPIPTRFPIP